MFADTASSWLHLDHDEASSAVVRAVTVGPGSGTQARKMLYLPQMMEGNTAVPSGRALCWVGGGGHAAVPLGRALRWVAGGGGGLLVLELLR